MTEPQQPPPQHHYYYSVPPPAAPARPVNGFAVAGMVLGILWVYWVGSILALIFGYVALRQIDEQQSGQSGRGMAVAAVVLGWVGVGLGCLVMVLAMISAAVGGY